MIKGRKRALRKTGFYQVQVGFKDNMYDYRPMSLKICTPTFTPYSFGNTTFKGFGDGILIPEMRINIASNNVNYNNANAGSNCYHIFLATTLTTNFFGLIKNSNVLTIYNFSLIPFPTFSLYYENKQFQERIIKNNTLQEIDIFPFSFGDGSLTLPYNPILVLKNKK